MIPRVTANGLELAWESVGDPAHPTILLVMGLGMPMMLWPDEFVARLVAQGFRVVRFDNRDAGQSTKFDQCGVPNVAGAYARWLLRLPVKAPYLLDDLARDTAGLIDALELGRPHVVGASMGGMIVQNLAALFPDKVASVTSIMSTTGARKLPQPTWEVRKALLRRPQKFDRIEGAIEAVMALLRLIGSRTHPPEEGYLRDLCTKIIQRGVHQPGTARQLVGIVASGDRTATVRRIAAPALVIHGTEDPLVRPAGGQATYDAIKAGGGSATLRMVPGMGHDIPVPLQDAIVADIAAHCRAAGA